MMNSIKSVTPRLTIRKAATAAAAGAAPQPSAPLSNAALSAAVATSHAGIATASPITLTPAAVPRKCGLPKATPVPTHRSVSPDPTIDYAGRSKVVSRTPRVPADATLDFLATFNIRYLIPGVGAGAGGENERTLSFCVLYDKIVEKMLIQMGVTGTFLTVHDGEHYTVRDLIHTFFRNKPITLCNMPAENLDIPLADLTKQLHGYTWSLRAY